MFVKVIDPCPPGLVEMTSRVLWTLVASR